MGLNTQYYDRVNVIACPLLIQVTELHVICIHDRYMPTCRAMKPEVCQSDE